MMLNTTTAVKTVEQVLASQLPATVASVNDGNRDTVAWGRWDNWDKDGEPWRN
jgi:hypothetical protein